jgi:hypothetical protein
MAVGVADGSASFSIGESDEKPWSVSSMSSTVNITRK